MCAYLKNIHSNHCNRKKFVFFFPVLQEEREREREREKLEQREIYVCIYRRKALLLIAKIIY
jgi:hypothetical protein